MAYKFILILLSQLLRTIFSKIVWDLLRICTPSVLCNVWYCLVFCLKFRVHEMPLCGLGTFYRECDYLVYISYFLKRSRLFYRWARFTGFAKFFFFFSYIFFGVLLCIYIYLCRPSEASTQYCVIPGGDPPQDWQSLPRAGEEQDSNPGLLICSQMRYHWATSPPPSFITFRSLIFILAALDPVQIIFKRSF